MPTYTLCPENRISGIVAEMGQAVEKIAGMVGGPIHLTGHSAGGHLATRLVCTNSPLSGAVLSTASATSSRSPACTIFGR